jgi:hypothetical protein
VACSIRTRWHCWSRYHLSRTFSTTFRRTGDRSWRIGYGLKLSSRSGSWGAGIAVRVLYCNGWHWDISGPKDEATIIRSQWSCNSCSQGISDERKKKKKFGFCTFLNDGSDVHLHQFMFFSEASGYIPPWGITSSSSVTWCRSTVSFDRHPSFWVLADMFMPKLAGKSLTLFWNQKQYTISSNLYHPRRQPNQSLNSLRLKGPRTALAVNTTDVTGRRRKGSVFCKPTITLIFCEILLSLLRGRVGRYKGLHCPCDWHCRCGGHASITGSGHWSVYCDGKAWQNPLRRLEY